MKHTIIYRLILLIILAALSYGAFGITGTAVTNGNWGTASVWSIGGVTRIPDCNDTVSIPSGRTVTVNAQHDYTGCMEPIYIYVGGTLQFNNGYKLSLPCHSTVNILAGGLVKKATPGGGNSTFIEICGDIEWKAGDGPLPGPAILGGNTLPISLTRFEVHSVEESARLSWSTASEINNDYFIIERSTDGGDFMAIAIVAGAGNSTNLIDYEFTDRSPVTGRSYYRLTQVDYDGRSSVSGIIPFISGKRNSFDLISATASNSVVKLFFTDEESASRQLKIYNLSGTLIESRSIETREGSNFLEFNSSIPVKGVLVLSIEDGITPLSRKVILAD